MKCLIILCAVLVAVSCQYGGSGYRKDPSLARILSDQRAHHVAGDFRLAVKQEDGTNIQEEATAQDGTRRGSYSYINDQGKTESVKWEAGPMGFRVLNANNQPAHTQHTAAYNAAAANLAREHAAANARVSEVARRAQPQYQSPGYQSPAVKQYQSPTARPYIHQSGPAKQARPYKVSNHHTYQHTPQHRPQQHHAPVQHYNPVQYRAPTTQAPAKRFFPPGQLSFSRNQLGYQYNFSS